jgi:hypothetical protein
MKRFAFRVSDEDHTHFTELALRGVHITVNIDPCRGGIFMLHEDATMNWTWLEEIELSGATAEDEEDALATFAEAGEAIASAVGVATTSPHAAHTASMHIELPVLERDFERLMSLQQVGYDIRLSLDPHTGGLDAAHMSGARLSWSFVTELDLEPQPEVGDLPRTDHLATMLGAFHNAIRA